MRGKPIIPHKPVKIKTGAELTELFQNDLDLLCRVINRCMSATDYNEPQRKERTRFLAKLRARERVKQVLETIQA